MIYKGKSKLNCCFIDNHIHGAFGVDFNAGNYDEIKYLLSKLYEKNIKGVCPTLVGDGNENIQRQLEIFKKIPLKVEFF